MAKVGILGQRHGSDEIKTTDYVPLVDGTQSNTFKVVYKVPSDVKMAVVDIDLFIQTVTDFDNSDMSVFVTVDISPTYTVTPKCTGVLVVDARAPNGGTVSAVEEYTLNTFQRKCLVLGPGDTVFSEDPPIQTAWLQVLNTSKQ